MSTPLALLDVLAQIPEPRDPRGVRHPLSAILSLAVLALLTGAKSYSAIAQFGRDKGFALAHALGFRRGKTPLHVHLFGTVSHSGHRRLRDGYFGLGRLPAAARRR